MLNFSFLLTLLFRSYSFVAPFLREVLISCRCSFLHAAPTETQCIYPCGLQWRLRGTAHPDEKCAWEHLCGKNKFTLHVKKRAAGKLQTEKGLTPFFENTCLNFFPWFRDLSYIFLTDSRFIDLSLYCTLRFSVVATERC